MITQLIHNGKAIKNQFVITRSGETIFQSYETVIAKKVETSNGVQVILDEKAFDYSQTTSKYLASFLGFSSAKEAKKNLKNYKYENLN